MLYGIRLKYFPVGTCDYPHLISRKGFVRFFFEVWRRSGTMPTSTNYQEKASLFRYLRNGLFQALPIVESILTQLTQSI